MVSVIIPNYNHAGYLNQRIDSVLNQTYQDIELIILDDVSKDNSREVIEQYSSHPKVSNIVFNDVNSGGTFKQWDKGIALAKGEYIWMAESDDYADSTFLESMMGMIEENPEIGLAYCGSQLVDETGVDVGEIVRHVKPNTNGYYVNSGYDECMDYAFFTPIIPNASGVIFKKSKYYEVDQSYKTFKICGDWQFWIDIAYDNYIAYLPKKLNRFRQSATSVSRSAERKDTLTIFALEKLRIARYVAGKTQHTIPFKARVKYVNVYLYEVLLESSRKRIFLSRVDVGFITKSMFAFTYLTPLLFVNALARITWRAVMMVVRKLVR